MLFSVLPFECFRRWMLRLYYFEIGVFKNVIFSAEDHEGEYPVKIEISPLLSYDGEVFFCF